MRSLLPVLAAIGVTVLAGATGCDGRRVDSSRTPAQPTYTAIPQSLPEPAITVVRNPTSISSIQLPVDAYTFTAPQSKILSRAEQLLVADCMRREGFTYMMTSQSLPSQHQEPFGLIGIASAAAYGYHDPGMLDGSKKFATSKPAYMTDSYLVALRGWATLPPPGAATAPGCQGDATNQIEVSGTTSDPAVVRQLALDARQRTQSDSRVRKALTQWSSCMNKKGFPYGTPAAAAAGPWSGATQAPSAAELSTATADVQCKAATDLVDIWLSVEGAYQTVAIARNIAMLTEVQRDNEARLSRADLVLSSHR